MCTMMTTKIATIISLIAAAPTLLSYATTSLDRSPYYHNTNLGATANNNDECRVAITENYVEIAAEISKMIVLSSGGWAGTGMALSESVNALSRSVDNALASFSRNRHFSSTQSNHLIAAASLPPLI